ncbi:STN domain-containing protein (plasmid) [Sphingomonas paucimobilis]|nr:STN domain-containing protein [Sphingomonas paucimobilis]
MQIVAPARKLAGKRTNAVNGTYSVEVALAKLLAGTGLRIGLRSGTNSASFPTSPTCPRVSRLPPPRLLQGPISQVTQGSAISW